MIDENLQTFAGKPVKDFELTATELHPADEAYRLRVGWDMSNGAFDELFDRLLAIPGADRIEALVIGDWGNAAEGGSSRSVVEKLVEVKDRLPGLKALFIGDLVGEESEISWIIQSDLSPLWTAYPGLTEFGVRGGEGLRLAPMSMPHLKTLVIETGGLPAEVVADVIAADLPELEHLDLWLGEENYGGDASIADLQPLLDGGLFPGLRWLGLRNSAISDDIAVALTGAGVIAQLDTLALSLGALSDQGVAALAANTALKSLKTLDIHFHYASPEALAKLDALGIEVDTSDPQEADEDDGEVYRYIFVGE